MKKLLTLVVAGCMVLGALGTAAAVDVKVSGQWQVHYGYYSSNTLMSNSDTGTHQDRLKFRQRFRTQVRFIADENLSGMLNFELGDFDWGNNSLDSASGGRQGGGLDADGYTIKVKWAYIDWTLPNTRVKTRMGIQPLALPAVVAGNPVFDADVAGVTMNTQLTPEVGLSAFWIRPYSLSNTSTSGQTGGKNNMDDMDAFGITLPIKTSVVRATPWVMGALIGRDSGYYGKEAANSNKIRATSSDGFQYAGGRPIGNRDKMDSTGYAWWAGTTFELPLLDPFFVNLDAMMGGLETGDSAYDAFGYFLAADVGYKFSFGRLSAVGWYSSGDSDKDDRGIIPEFAEVGGFKPTRYGLSGTKNRSYDDALGTIGFGMWGAGLQLADVSFLDNLKHTFRAMYMRGTNKGESLYGSGAGNTSSWSTGTKLMSSDSAYEFNILNEYTFSKNLSMSLDFVYLNLDLGPQWTNKDETTGSFATMLGFQYKF